MHKVEQRVNGKWEVVARFCLLADAHAYRRLKGGLVIPKDMTEAAADSLRLDEMEAEYGWFSAADEVPEWRRQRNADKWCGQD
jgi:hypothetical protein